jgi:hypothetical protein
MTLLMDKLVIASEVLQFRVSLRNTGLPRRFAPRNDEGGVA